jgi:hypothetical protein
VHGFRAGLVLGLGLVALIKTTVATALWVMWCHDVKRAR